MHINHRWFAVLLVAGLGLTGCGGVPGAASDQKAETAVKLVPIKGTDIHRLVLTKKAIQVLNIKTAPVRSVSGGPGQLVPYAAVMYGPEGNTYTYTNPAPRVYVKHQVKIDRIQGAMALVRQGPPAGTPVVVVGESELLGAENGVEE